VKREATRASKSQHSALSTQSLTVIELGPGNGNLAACFLSHLKILDKDGRVYPRIRYVLVDWEQAVLDAAGTRVPPQPDRDASGGRGSA
jgi:16S rRNA A1518/A1519 N6-dimethyltransferase RsmA/KsgA/DIM1 with predicted DNA glycosylase/AP lyase activity